jgi:hypothetical protein
MMATALSAALIVIKVKYFCRAGKINRMLFLCMN